MQIKFLMVRNFVFQRFQFFSCLCPHFSIYSPLISAPLPLPRTFVRMLT